MSAKNLVVTPVSLADANSFVMRLHRHHSRTQGHKFSIGAVNLDRKLVGVAICGRPVSRALDTGLRLEVTRLCTDGTHNACSFLYGACARIAKSMGYANIDTYTLPTESGSSLRAAGWQSMGEAGGSTWHNPKQGRHRLGPSLVPSVRIRWELQLFPKEEEISRTPIKRPVFRERDSGRLL